MLLWFQVNPYQHIERFMTDKHNVARNLNFADDPLYPPETDPMPGIVKRFPNISTVIVPASDKTMGHMTLTEPAVWLPYVEKDIRAALAR